MAAAKEGKTGSECRGEEHEVVLVWSVRKGKTTVFWNKSNISHLFPEEQLRTPRDLVEYKWELRSGETVEIQANANPIPGRPQYDLIVGGVSFFSLPHVSELRGFEDDVASALTSEDRFAESLTTDSFPGEAKSGASCNPESLPVTDDLDVPPEDLGFRLSMAGFASSEKQTRYELQDELTSELNCSTLENLRARITASIPDTEEMVSRAIINAFSDDRDSQTSFDSSSSCESYEQHEVQVEVDAYRETYQWINLNVDYAPRPDVEDQKQAFLQKQMDTIFSHVRHERLTSDAAIRVLVTVAVILGRRINISFPRDTIVMTELEKSVGVEDLIDCMCNYGEVQSVAVSKGNRFGMCTV